MMIFLLFFSLATSAETQIQGHKFWHNAYEFCYNLDLRLPTTAEIWQIKGGTNEWYWTNEEGYAYNPSSNKKSNFSSSTAAGFCVPLGILGKGPNPKERKSRQSQDQYDCIDTKKKNTLSVWELYLKEHPDGVCSFEAKIKIAEFKEREQLLQNIELVRMEEERSKKEEARKKAENAQWSSLSSNKMTHSDAGEYCRNLREDGFPDWHLPTIDELRMLIENCPQTVIGGTCKEMSSSCSCENRLPGYYSKFDDEGRLWSSSTYTHKGDRVRATTFSAWYVDFNSGGFGLSNTHYSPNDVASVRCIRTKTYKDQSFLRKNSTSNTAKELQWSNKAAKKMFARDAVDYCENLSENGHNDWRLPTISELRSLIQNCEETETGGSCGVTENCLSQNNCKNKACDGCEDTTIQYSKLGDKSFFWSSSFRPESSNNAWYIDFTYASIHGHSDSKKSVRCVR